MPMYILYIACLLSSHLCTMHLPYSENVWIKWYIRILSLNALIYFYTKQKSKGLFSIFLILLNTYVMGLRQYFYSYLII